jgi:uncharacterized protein
LRGSVGHRHCRRALLGVVRAVQPQEGAAMATIDKEFLDILVCPKTKSPLVQSGDWLYSTDPETRLRYPIRDDIPIMLIDEAETVDEEEFKKVLESAK